ncbi:MAG TPA: AI-2E family transporter [Desulfomonilaceae bacterium]|nr:AI-2E family transporter [Desulfomonilaceae bacterium]
MNQPTKTMFVRLSAAVAFFAVLVWLMSALHVVTTIIMVAFVLAYILHPVVHRLQRWGLGSGIASLLVVVLCLFLIGGLVLFIVPTVFQELTRFGKAFPAYWSALQDALLHKLEMLNLSIPKDWDELTAFAVERVKQVLPDLADTATKIVSSVFASTLQVISILFYALLIPVLTYYLLASFESMKQQAYELMPPYAREPVIDKLKQIDTVLAGFIRGQFIICLILAVLYSIGFFIIGIDLAIFLGMISGLLFIVPYFGTMIGIVFGSLMALAKFGDLTHVLYVLGWIGCVQLLEGYLLTPRIVGQAIGLNPVVYILALIAAGNLFGFVGLLVAIPVTAVLKVLLVTLVDMYRHSYLYAERVDGKLDAE